jgi:hypothetical protein
MLAETGLQDLMMTNDEIDRRDKGKFIFKHWYAYWQMKKRNRIREAATLKIQTYWRMWLVKNSSFLKALEVEKYPKLYFLKEQKPQFIKILRALLPQLTQANMTLEDAISSISEDQKYDTIRVEEPDLFKF